MKVGDSDLGGFIRFGGARKGFTFSRGVSGPPCKWEIVIGAEFGGLESREWV